MLVLDDPEFRRMIRRLACKLTQGTRVSWEDAEQAAHIKILSAFQAGKFQGDTADVCRWAVRVAQHEMIDLIRREVYRCHISLHQTDPRTQQPLLDTISDYVDPRDAIELQDLAYQAEVAIARLDQRYPDRQYLQLWQGLALEKTQVQIAQDLSLSQGAVSKRFRELRDRVMLELGLVENRQAAIPPGEERRRSKQQW